MVSIIIPTYNTEKYILETINLVISQIYEDWELIVIDDGSTDKTAQIVNDIVKKDNRVKYFYQKNSGVSVARNFGLEKTEGDIIALLDADDLWNNNKLDEISEVFSNHKIDWVFSDVINLFEDGTERIKEIQSSDNLLNSLLSWDGNVLTAPSGIAFRKKCYTEGISFDKQFSTAADQDFVIQLASKYNGYHIDKVLWKYRILNNSMSRNIAVMEKDHIGVFRKAAKNKLFKSFWFKQQCFSNLYWILAGSWWKDGNNKKRGLYFIIRALFANPFSFVKIFNKI